MADWLDPPSGITALPGSPATTWVEG